MLDRAIQRAAAATHVAYVADSPAAFGGHERCTANQYLNASFDPKRFGQAALAAQMARALSQPPGLFGSLAQPALRSALP
jgi:hypothetical protein